MDPLSALYLSRVDMSRERCATREGIDAWRVAVRTISDDTSAFLDPPELEGIWSKVASSACYGDLSGDDKTWADLLAAVARRSAPEIAAHGSELLASASSKSADDRAYLTTVTAAALIRMGAIAQAHAVLQAQWRRFDHAGQFDLALRELAALAAAPD